MRCASILLIMASTGSSEANAKVLLTSPDGRFVARASVAEAHTQRVRISTSEALLTWAEVRAPTCVHASKFKSGRYSTRLGPAALLLLLTAGTSAQGDPALDVR